MPTDFRDGKTFPRRGREALDGMLWLARLFDKARAAHAGTIHDYIYPCPMDLGVLERWGVDARAFDEAVRRCTNDDDILAWVKERTAPERVEAANRWLLQHKSSNLDHQDAEEGHG